MKNYPIHYGTIVYIDKRKFSVEFIDKENGLIEFELRCSLNNVSTELIKELKIDLKIRYNEITLTVDYMKGRVWKLFKKLQIDKQIE